MTLNDLYSILEKAAQHGCKIQSDLQRGCGVTKRTLRGSYYIEIRHEETDDCEAFTIKVRFSDHKRQLSSILNHEAPTIETTNYDIAAVCKQLEAELSFLWN